MNNIFDINLFKPFFYKEMLRDPRNDKLSEPRHRKFVKQLYV